MSTTNATNTTTRGVTLRDLSAGDFIKAYAKFLKRSGRVDVPKWADVVKTGTHKQLAPLDPDWFYVRMGKILERLIILTFFTAAVARRIYLRGGNGIGRLTKVYGGAKKRGSRPRTFVNGSGAIIRSCVKQLEKLQVVEKDTKGYVGFFFLLFNRVQRKKNHFNWNKRSRQNCRPSV